MTHEVGLALARVLGIDCNARRVTGFDVRCRVDEVVEVTVHEVIYSGAALQHTEECFELRQQKRAFDLDRMCLEATERVNSFIEARARAIRMLVTR